MGQQPTPVLPAGVRRVHEVRTDLPVPLHAHPEWEEDFPWLVQGTTGAAGSFDLGLFGDMPVGKALERWRQLRAAVGMPRAVHSMQVHESRIQEHEEDGAGLVVSEGFDGHGTGSTGVLLTVSVADCVPISLVDPDRRRVALVHGGWRGTVDGILGRGLEWLGSDPARLRVHMGPAICGECYEVGPEVHEALGLEVPESNTPVDLRAVQARWAVEAGVPAEAITVSGHCTRCGRGDFFSHRGGSAGRQVGVLGIRP